MCHGIYSKTDIVTKAPAAALTVPKSVIENDYIYRKNFKEKYGIELPKYITILSYFWDSMTDNLFMQLDDIDTNLLSNTNGNRWEYIGELLSDVFLDALSTELSSEISRQRKSKTPDNAKIAKYENKQDSILSKREFEKSDGTFSVSLSKENAEAYPKARKKCGGVFDEMLSKLPEYANELTECANECEEDDLFEKYKETFLQYTPKYGVTFLTLAKIYREDFLEPVQYYGEQLINILSKEPTLLNGTIDISAVVKDIEKSIGKGKKEEFSAGYKAEYLNSDINRQLLQQRINQYNFDDVIDKTILHKTYAPDRIDKRPSSVLREELYLAGVGSPPYPNAAHHIVAIKDSEAKPARDILAKYGIDLNSAANGVFLPYKYNEFVGDTSYHVGGHNDKYFDEVNDRIKRAEKYIT